MPRYAAIDIGSNSVRMMAAEVEPRAPMRVLAEDRQVTRLGESVFRTGRVNRAALDFLCSVLQRMVAAYRPLGILASRAVATAAVRDAANSEEVIERVNEIVDGGVEVISGQEEARLIHLGVETNWPHPRERILIVDIGGGSAEIIEAHEGKMRAAFSRPLGAVRLQSVFLQNDPAAAEDLRRMNEFIDEKLAPAARRIEAERLHARHRHVGLGVGHRLRGQPDSAAAAGRGGPPPRHVTQVRRLYKDLAAMTVNQRRAVTGIGPRRAEIIVAGAAVLVKVLDRFQIPHLAYSAAGVRDGIIRDLANRGAGHERARLQPEQRRLVEQFARRFGVDLKHARKVAGFASELFHALAPWHRLGPEQGRLLEAAAILRDTGHAINDMSHHRHSQYIVANSDLAGFTDDERQEVAMLCRYHRKSMPAARHAEFQALGPERQRVVLLLAPVLRIADALDRSRDQRVERIECALTPAGFDIELESTLDTSLEQWAVERAAPEFRQVFERGLTARAGAAVRA